MTKLVRANLLPTGSIDWVDPLPKDWVRGCRLLVQVDPFPDDEITAETRAELWGRCGGFCECGCRQSLSPNAWDPHHIHPRSTYHGPDRHSPNNLMAVSRECHQRIEDTPGLAQKYRELNPVQQEQPGLSEKRRRRSGLNKFKAKGKCPFCPRPLPDEPREGLAGVPTCKACQFKTEETTT